MIRWPSDNIKSKSCSPHISSLCLKLFFPIIQLQQNQSMEKADKYTTEVKMLKSENALLQDELRRAKESVEKTPSNVMSSLVDKLRSDISEKEKKIRAMGRIIADLKTELVDNAVAKDRKETVDSMTTLNQKEDLDEATRRLEELTIQNENLTKQIETFRSKQVCAFVLKRYIFIFTRLKRLSVSMAGSIYF